MPEPVPEPNRNFGNTQLDLSQPDGIPRERNSDGTFKAEKPSEAPTPVPSHPAYLADLAKSFGFDDDDMKAMSSEALGRAITKAQKRDADWNQRLQSQKPPVKAPEPEPEFDLGVDLSQYDEGFAGAFEKLKQARIQDAKALKEIRQELLENKERERARSHQQAIQIADDAFEALGPEYEEYFGKGALVDIQSNQTVLRRRIIALQETGLDMNVASGKQILSRLKKVADEVLGIKPKPKEEKPEEEARQSGRPTRREWDRGGTAVPTQRGNAEEPKGYERAVRNAERKAAANGGPVTPNHAKEDAEILATFKR